MIPVINAEEVLVLVINHQFLEAASHYRHRAAATGQRQVIGDLNPKRKRGNGLRKSLACEFMRNRCVTAIRFPIHFPIHFHFRIRLRFRLLVLQALGWWP